MSLFNADEYRPVQEREYQTPVGWDSLRPTGGEIEAARSRRIHGDAVDPNGMENTASGLVRAEGHIAEAIFSRWLTGRHVEHEWDGGPNPNPDFVVGGVAVGVRITARRSGRFRYRDLIYIFDRHIRGAPERFFIGVHRGEGRYYILGGIRMDSFVAAARPVPRGGLMCPGFTAQHDLHVATIGDLEAPDEWLRRVHG